MPDPTPRPRFALELESLPEKPGDSRPSVRLRVLLKRLQRSYGFRCRSAVEVPEGWKVAVVKAPAERPPCTCGHAHLRHCADGEGVCMDCACMGWTPQEEEKCAPPTEAP